MRRYLAFALVIACTLLEMASCTAGTSDDIDSETGFITADMLAQGVYDVLRLEWEHYDSLSAEEKLASSQLPGYCWKDFADWASCEEFLGISVPNPLEDSTWLEKGTYAGMPEGFQNAPRVQATWYGTREGHVEWVGVQGGYRSGKLQIILNADLYGNPAEETDTSSRLYTRPEQSYNAENQDTGFPAIPEDDGDEYAASTAYLVQGYVYYRIRVVGEKETRREVQETLGVLLTDFGVDASVV